MIEDNRLPEEDSPPAEIRQHTLPPSILFGRDSGSQKQAHCDRTNIHPDHKS
jgi:hypothetical protein